MLILTLICTAAMLLMPSQSIQGAQNGITLCLTAVIPSLFPFFICSRMLLSSGIAELAGRKAGKIFEALFGVRRSCAFAFAAGILSGYPVGAKVVTDMYKNRLCSKAEAQRMLAFCNNSGPLFIIGTVGAGMLHSTGAGFLLYAGHILSAVAAGLTVRFIIPVSGRDKSEGIVFRTSRLNASFQNALADSLKSMASVCGNILFFSVIISALTPVFGMVFKDPMLNAAAGGIIEISTGIDMLSTMSRSLPVIGFLLAWSGVSVIMQVNGIISGSGLNTGVFAVCKLIQGIYGGVFTLLLMRLSPSAPPAAAANIYTAAHTCAAVIIAALLLSFLAFAADRMYRSLCKR